MPIQHSVSVNKPAEEFSANGKIMTRNDCLLRLRERELLAYHHVCGVFRAQGPLTPEKLKLLKELSAALFITEARHHAECCIAVNDQELTAIAACVYGPNSDTEWKKEGRIEPPPYEPRINTAATEMCDAVANAIREAWKRDGSSKTNKDKSVPVTVKLKARWFEDMKKTLNSIHDDNEHLPDVKTDLKSETDIKEESESISSESLAIMPSEFSSQEEETPKESPNMATNQKEDAVLMPPPPPPPTYVSSVSSVITVPPVMSFSSSSPATSAPPSVPLITVPPVPLITVPPSPPPTLATPLPLPPSSYSPSVITVPACPPVITVPPPSSITVIPAANKSLSYPSTSTSVSSTEQVNPIANSFSSEIPSSESETNSSGMDLEVLESDDVQFMSFPESLESSLPPLVVVPPPEPPPVITVPHSSSFSPSTPTSTHLVLSTGLPVKAGEMRKRKRPLSQDTPTSTQAAPKTISLSQLSKITPVMVSTVSAHGQVKMTPYISKTKLVPTTQSVIPTTAHKVIIMSNPSSSSSSGLQRTLNMGSPLIRANQTRLQGLPGLIQSNSGPAKIRPKLVNVTPRGRGKSPVVVPVGSNTITLSNTVIDANMKRMPLGTGPTKILPKPQGSMFIVNSATGKIGPAAGGGPRARMISPGTPTTTTTITTTTTGLKPVGNKQNVVILQKGGGNQRVLPITNAKGKDFMQRLNLKKCVVIPSSKVVPKNQASQLSSKSTVAGSKTSKVVILDLTKDPNYIQNMKDTTLADILHASGIITSSTATTSFNTTTTVAASEASSSWLPMEASKSLSMEEVSLPIGHTQSVVTLDEAVQLLGESSEQQDLVAGTESFCEDNTSATIQMSSADAPHNILTITPEELAASDITFIEDKTDEPGDCEMIGAYMETLPSEENDNTALVSTPAAMVQSFLAHKDGAVTIQHSNLDMMPTNMSLEEYSSQQMENQGLN